MRGLGLLANTFFLAAGCCAVSLPAGVTLSTVLLRCDLPLRRLALLVLLMPLFVPLYLQAAGWDAGFGRQGWASLSWMSLNVPLLDGWRAAIFIHAVAALPWVVLIVGLGLRYVESELEELALLDAGVLGAIWSVTLPRVAPAIGVAALWIGLMVATEMTVTDLYQVRTLTEQIYLVAPQQGFDLADLPWPPLLVGVVVLAVIGLGVVAALAPAAMPLPPRRQAVFHLGRARWPLAIVVHGLVGALVGIPVVNLVINAGMQVRLVDGQPTRSWEAMKALQMVAESPLRFSREFGWTLLIGGLAGTAAVMFAVALAWLACRRRVAAWLTIVSTACGLALPGPLLGLLVIAALNRDVSILQWLYDRTVLPPCLAMFIRSLPLAILINWYALRSVPREVLELAAIEGAGAAEQLIRIAAPQRAGALATAWLAAVAIAMGDLAATILVTPPGMSTIALRVFGLLHAGVDDQVAGLCLTTLVLFSALGALALWGWPRGASGVRTLTGGGYNT